MDSQCSIELFGGIRVEQGKRVITRFRTQKTASLIAYLAYFGDRMHSREVLIEMLWPEAGSQKAGKTSLSVALSSLRNQLEPPDVPANSLLFADRQSIGLSPLVVTDTTRFEKAARDAARARSRQEREEEKRLLLTALALYRDKLLPGHYEVWINPQQERLAEQYRLAVRRLSSLYEEDGDLDSAIACAQRAALSDPSDEDISQELIRLLLKQDGDSAPDASGSSASFSAVKHYQRLEQALSETGQTPSVKTRALIAPLLKQVPALPVPPARAAPASRRRSRLSVLATAGRGGGGVAVRESAPVFAVAAASQERTRLSTAKITALQVPAAPSPAPLPKLLTRFFGRQNEMATIAQLLASGDHRLITLTGPGGSGKTRIALETARQQRERTPEPQEGEEIDAPEVHFISLTEAVNIDLFVAALRSALGVYEEEDSDPSPLLSLVHALKGRRTLLVLDGFEQIAESGSELLEQLMERVPGLTCLVTSRQRLPISGEREVPIPPFSTSALGSNFAVSNGVRANTLSDSGFGGEINLADLLDSHPAAALFVDRAQHVRTDFQINRRNADSILELVHRLEGIPLAIELAAARTQVLTPRQMLDRLEKRFDLLESHRKVAGRRHQSLRETLQFSYEMLSPQLQAFFNNLALFRGGCTAEAVEAVTQSPIALDLLAQLCDASLLRVAEQDNGEIRFQMLETVREFALEKQREDDPSGQERLQAEARHLAFFAELAEETDKMLMGGTMQGDTLAVLEADHDNIRAALRRTLRSVQSVFAATESLRLIASLHNFWFIRSHFTEGRNWDKQFWDRLRAGRKKAQSAEIPSAFSLDSLLLARAVNGSGVLAMSQGDYKTADRCYRHSLRLCKSVGDRRGIAATLNNVGNSYSKQGNWEIARSLYEQASSEWRILGDTRLIARLAGNMGVIEAEQGNYSKAQKYFQEGLDSARIGGETRGTAVGLCNLGHVYYKMGNTALAETLLMESLSAAYELKDYSQSGAALLCLGFVRSARATQDVSGKTVVQAERETGPQFLRIAVESYREMNIPLPRYAASEMRDFPAATFKTNGFPFTGLQALQNVLERWLPEHAL